MHEVGPLMTISAVGCEPSELCYPKPVIYWSTGYSKMLVHVSANHRYALERGPFQDRSSRLGG